MCRSCVQYIELIVYGVRSIFRRLALRAVGGGVGRGASSCKGAACGAGCLCGRSSFLAAAEYTLLALRGQDSRAVWNVIYHHVFGPHLPLKIPLETVIYVCCTCICPAPKYISTNVWFTAGYIIGRWHAVWHKLFWYLLMDLNLSDPNKLSTPLSYIQACILQSSVHSSFLSFPHLILFYIRDSRFLRLLTDNFLVLL